MTPPAGAVGQRERGLWWASPPGVLLLILPLSLLLAVFTSDIDFRLLYRTPKVLTGPDTRLMMFAGAFVLLGTLLPLVLRGGGWARPWPGFDERQLATLRRSADVCFYLTIVGYVAFGLAGLARGVSVSDITGVLTSQDNYSGGLKQAFAPVTGITTLTQVGLAYVVLGGLLLINGHGNGVRRRLAVVVVLALLRAFFLTERLAVVEVVVPLALLLAVHRSQRVRPPWWLPSAPVLALPVLIAGFGLFEYSRSWVFFRSRTTSSFPEFVVNRLAGYYSTAYNNSAIQLHHDAPLGGLPYASLEALWTAPGAQQLHLYERLTGVDGPASYALLLEQFGTPEFNNPGGLAVPLIDFGVPVGLLIMLVVGVLVGAAYRSFRSGSPLGLLIYPLVFTGLLELPRYFYWTQGRLVPAVLVLGITSVLLRRRPLPVPAPLAAPSRAVHR